MFRRLSHHLPKDPSYNANLDDLGFTLTPDGRFVKKDDTDSFFDFFHTDNERANEVRKEAMHGCARSVVLSQLAEVGIAQLYVHDGGFARVKPDSPHVTILTTELGALSAKRDVIVVIGESMQDLGVWAYRILMREGGVQQGSAVGLANKLRAWGSGGSAKGPVTGEDGVEEAMKDLRINSNNARATASPRQDAVPGLIILNPGQLLYSPSLNECMSQAAWLGRPRKDALSDPFRIDPVHNRVKGHETPDAHIASILSSLSPKIVRKDVRFYFVGLSEGGEAMLNYLDEALQDAGAIGDNLEAIALVQPTHVPSQLESPALATLLAARGRSWVMSSGQPKGTLLAVPNSAGVPITHYTDKDSTSLPQLLSKTIPEPNDEIAPASPSATAPIAIPGRSPPTHRTHSPAQSRSNLEPNGNGAAASYSFPKSPGTLEQSVASLQTNPGSLMEQSSYSTLSKSNANLADSDADSEPDPYADEEVSCPTFSSGVEGGVTEVIWPSVMDDVLEWFREVREMATAEQG